MLAVIVGRRDYRLCCPVRKIEAKRSVAVKVYKAGGHIAAFGIDQRIIGQFLIAYLRNNAIFNIKAFANQDLIFSKNLSVNNFRSQSNPLPLSLSQNSTALW